MSVNRPAAVTCPRDSVLYLFRCTVDDEQVAPLCLTPGSAGAPGQTARGEEVTLCLELCPTVGTRPAEPL